MKLRALGFLLATSALASCAVAPRPAQVANIYAADGRQAHYLECAGTPLNCHERARQQCGGSYIPLVENRRMVISSDPIGAYSRQIFELTFRCDEGGRPP